ncbi:hypothetical protein [uncultured Cloacibacillus sp.]|uniref:hypothetical protein n=1 Tax=uncultured Cloacibacillus sp. TaxID=889794 RepID=UPI00320A1092
MGILPESRRFWQAPARALKIQTFFDISTPQKSGRKAPHAPFFMQKIAIFYDINNEVQKQARRDAAARTTEE